MRQNLFYSKIVGLLLLLLFSSAVQAEDGALRDIRLWTAPDHTRLVLDLSGKIEYELFRLHDPERIVIDMQQTELKT
ncbi:MAG: N-acetylmuramoyl-L-alanine amidase, partial [Zetaproteobacteria bacterium CG_4_9_14_3_um_filter_53_7]